MHTNVYILNNHLNEMDFIDQMEKEFLVVPTPSHNETKEHRSYQLWFYLK